MSDSYTKLSFRNKAILSRFSQCGCYHCLHIFDTKCIVEWITESDNQQTALCPHCGVDSVIPAQKENFESILNSLMKTQFM